MQNLQNKIIKELYVAPEIDVVLEIRRSVDFLKAYMLRYPFLKALVLGISGGQDSTLSGKLAQMAMTELREETGDVAYRFIAIRLPYGEQADEKDAIDAITFMGADESVRVNIKSSVDAMVQALEETDISISDFVKGNVKARQRMIAQYAVAGMYQGAVIGTDHAAEAVTGFFTKFGDGGTDINPLVRLNKRQGGALLKELGAPEHLYVKVPTADLEENNPGLPDEVALGVTYEEIDDYLEGKTIDDKAAKQIEDWYLKTQHKRHLPITPFDDFWK
ncbi:NAD+ synthase [Carnobacterium iners]|uniref:NH(3)-dependent NAD(+) synthetase n=1 Tax=Carnobacterium iners TaxID=1073423 RepID=A0A1X7MQN7_9LACT|nr:ammonia-dependent NAD(+) synthetase [Carnobacterium iners]SEL28300.1 NAD+ synthase [Carnobacterium iners]SMH26924.1 NAD+ synthase [Carnobacterium iners]